MMHSLELGEDMLHSMVTNTVDTYAFSRLHMPATTDQSDPADMQPASPTAGAPAAVRKDHTEGSAPNLQADSEEMWKDDFEAI
jgi:hypothetical protein